MSDKYLLDKIIYKQLSYILTDIVKPIVLFLRALHCQKIFSLLALKVQSPDELFWVVLISIKLLKILKMQDRIFVYTSTLTLIHYYQYSFIAWFIMQVVHHIPFINSFIHSFVHSFIHLFIFLTFSMWRVYQGLFKKISKKHKKNWIVNEKKSSSKM